MPPPLFLSLMQRHKQLRIDVVTDWGGEQRHFWAQKKGARSDRPHGDGRTRYDDVCAAKTTRSEAEVAYRRRKEPKKCCHSCHSHTIYIQYTVGTILWYKTSCFEILGETWIDRPIFASVLWLYSVHTSPGDGRPRCPRRMMIAKSRAYVQSRFPFFPLSRLRSSCQSGDRRWSRGGDIERIPLVNDDSKKRGGGERGGEAE